MKSNRLLYLPVETKAREFLGKTFLAARGAERGWTVILGEGNQLREFMRDRPRGAYIEIGIPEKKAKRLEEIHASGHCIANMCEEGLVYSDGGDYCDRKLGRSCIAWTDRLLVVGPRNAHHIRSHRPEFADKLAVTGNPRFDILLSGPRCVYRRDANALRQELGRFLLVSTNFTRANPYGGGQPGDVGNLIKRGMITSTAHEEFFHRFIDYQRRLMGGLQDVLQKLAASGLVDRIVIRPHPVENHESWREWARPLNIDVRYEGSAIEWMFAAEAVLHPGCTTAIEGLVLDRPVFSYAPEPDSEFLNPADDISEQVTSAEDFLGRLSEVRRQDEAALRARFASQREKLDYLIANVEPPYAADRILNELEKLDLPEARSKQADGRRMGFMTELRRRFRKWRRSDQERVARRRQKFPGMAASEAEFAVGSWVEAGVLGKVPRIDRLGERLLMFQ
jgi:surface carbohydrate biosynthesis protein